MGNFQSIEVRNIYLISGEQTADEDPQKNSYNVRLKVEPPLNDDFKQNYCLAGCPLYTYAPDHNDDGSCSGPSGDWSTTCWTFPLRARKTNHELTQA